MEDPIGIEVIFNERGYWSKVYTYLHNKPLDVGTLVVVPTQHFFNVAKVVGCTSNFPRERNGKAISYNRIKAVLKD